MEKHHAYYRASISRRNFDNCRYPVHWFGAGGLSSEIRRTGAHQRIGSVGVVDAPQVPEDPHVVGDHDGDVLARIGLTQDLGVGLLEVIAKLFLYFLHEHVWNGLSFGRLAASAVPVSGTASYSAQLERQPARRGSAMA